MIRGIVGCVLVLIIFLAGNNLFACDAELMQKSKDTFKVYIETISKKGDKERVNKEIAETLMQGVLCDSSPLPPISELRNIRGHFNGIFVLFEYAGIKNATVRPDLKSVNESYERVVKLHKEGKVE